MRFFLSWSFSAPQVGKAIGAGSPQSTTMGGQKNWRLCALQYHASFASPATRCRYSGCVMLPRIVSWCVIVLGATKAKCLHHPEDFQGRRAGFRAAGQEAFLDQSAHESQENVCPQIRQVFLVPSCLLRRKIIQNTPWELCARLALERPKISCKIYGTDNPKQGGCYGLGGNQWERAAEIATLPTKSQCLGL